MSIEEELEAVKKEVERLKEVVREMTAAMKLLTEKEERARAFVERVEKILNG